MAAESEFDPHTYWGEIRRAWPLDKIQKEHEWGEKAYKELAVDRYTAELVKAAVERYVRTVGVGKRHRMDLFFSQGYWQAFMNRDDVGGAPAIPPPKVVSEPTPKVQDEIEDALRYFQVWPVPWDRKETHVRACLRRLRDAGELEEALATARYFLKQYANPKAGIRFATGLVRFLSEGWRGWAEGVEAEPAPGDEEAFGLAWADYPHQFAAWLVDAEEARQDGATLYRRHVKPDERLDFRFAVRAYALQVARDRTEGMYVMRWPAFLGGWKQMEPKKYFDVLRYTWSATIARVWREAMARYPGTPPAEGMIGGIPGLPRQPEGCGEGVDWVAQATGVLMQIGGPDRTRWPVLPALREAVRRAAKGNPGTVTWFREWDAEVDWIVQQILDQPWPAPTLVTHITENS